MLKLDVMKAFNSIRYKHIIKRCRDKKLTSYIIQIIKEYFYNRSCVDVHGNRDQHDGEGSTEVSFWPHSVEHILQPRLGITSAGRDVL